MAAPSVHRQRGETHIGAFHFWTFASFKVLVLHNLFTGRKLSSCCAFVCRREVAAQLCLLHQLPPTGPLVIISLHLIRLTSKEPFLSVTEWILFVLDQVHVPRGLTYKTFVRFISVLLCRQELQLPCREAPTLSACCSPERQTILCLHGPLGLDVTAH